IKISKGLEKVARVMDRATLIRSYQAGDLGFILHSRHQYQWHTGYAPPQTVAAPHIGAVISRTLGPREPAMPAFIDIGQRFDLGEGEELKAFHTAGFLGSEYGPFGQGCLLARRLVEAGARFIEVTTEYIPFKYWDTHDNGHERAADLKKTIDAPVAQLILDLEERGLLDHTLVVLASEFSRDMVMEGRPGAVVK